MSLIVRLQNPNDYAYVIRDPSGIQRTRVDTAEYHPVPVGPDHVHRQLDSVNKKGAIAGSPTYGLLATDWQFLRREIEQVESEWPATHESAPDASA